jgi:NitT/TauT family transport system substrate-binding protein
MTRSPLAIAFLSMLLIQFGAFADLRVGLMPANNSIPFAVAEKEGLFAAEGIRVELLLFSSQLNRETALQTDAIDGTVSDLINAIQAWARGFGAKVTSVTEGSFGLLSAPQSKLRRMADWDTAATVRTGLLENSIVYYVTERMLESAGADPARLMMVPIVAVPTRLEMLIAGKIDAACLPEPLATLAVKQGAHLLADTDNLGSLPGVLLFTRKALAEKTSEIAAFYRAYDQAVEAYNKRPEAYRAAVAATCGFPAAASESMVMPRFQPAFLPPTTQVDDVAAWMSKKGLLTRVPRYEEIVRSGFARTLAAAP